MSREAENVRRAFERVLMVAPLPGEVERQKQGAERPTIKHVEFVYDHARNLFKTKLENIFVRGDILRLKDGRAFRIDAVKAHTVEDVPVFWELEAAPLAGSALPAPPSSEATRRGR